MASKVLEPDNFIKEDDNSIREDEELQQLIDNRPEIVSTLSETGVYNDIAEEIRATSENSSVEGESPSCFFLRRWI